MPSSSGDRRKHRRIPVRIPAGIFLKGKPDCLEAMILDLSVGGAFVHCLLPIALGDELMLEIRFGESLLFEARVVLAGEKSVPPVNPGLSERVMVKWARGSARSGFGVEFLDLTDEHREYLSKLLQHIDRQGNAGP